MSNNHRRSTKFVHWGRDPKSYHGVVNPPLVRTSTILYENFAAYLNPNTRFRYGRINNPLSENFENVMAQVEGGHKAISTCSGLAAITTTMFAFCKAGDHVLIVDGLYPPARGFAQRNLTKMGVEVEFFDPHIGADIKNLIKPNTAFIYMESPCSVTFEVMDVPAITKIAKEKGIITIIDNTWSSGVLFNPIKHGVNIVLMSCAKYVSGHSDINLGVVITDNEENYKRLKYFSVDAGQCASPEDLVLALRGLRTIEMRFKAAEENAARIIDWFKTREEIEEIFYPALETHRGHSIWKRDFKGANGIFSVMFREEYPMKSIEKFIDSLKLFPIGSSWGGYETLIQPQNLKPHRLNWDRNGYVLRFQIGHEDSRDLVDDLTQAMTNLKLKKKFIWY